MTEHPPRHWGADAPIEPPRFERCPPLLIAGLRIRAGGPAADIAALWQRFASQPGRVGATVDKVGYGLCLRAASGEPGCFDYLAGCAVADFAGIPAGWSEVRIPAQRYAVFAHREHVSKLQDAVAMIFALWLPTSGCETVRAGAEEVGFFERYGEGFDPRAGSGDIEIWVPIRG